MAETTALTKTSEKFQSLAKLLGSDNVKKQLAAALPKHITPERIARVALSTLQRTPKLLECDQRSFLSCVMACAALGLEPDGLLGQAYLVPFRSRDGMVCTVIPGYQGLMKLARQSGEIASIDAHPVRYGDVFEYRYGADPYIKHVPAERPYSPGDGWAKDWKPGEITHFYAVAKLKDGSVAFVVMPSWEVDEIRDGSQGYQAAKKFNGSSPWETDYDRMGCKTAIRRLCKYLPASVEDNRLHQAIAIDERSDRGVDQDLGGFVDVDSLDIPAEQPPTPGPEEEGRKMKLGGKAEPADK